MIYFLAVQLIQKSIMSSIFAYCGRQNIGEGEKGRGRGCQSAAGFNSLHSS
jgi:hypothetical protein